MTRLGPLTVVPPFAVAPAEGGAIVLTRKFVEGMKAYARSWPGPVRVVLHPTSERSTDLDHVTVRPGELPFGVTLCAFDSPGFPDTLAGSGVVLGVPDHRLPHLPAVCARLGVPCVYVTEYSLRTRLQIGRIDLDSRLRRMKRAVWEVNQERRTLQHLWRIAGVQCNGTPTYEAYRYVSRNPLLYFDTRTELRMFASADDLQQREQRVRSGKPLTLAFSGRLLPMKGAEHLLEVAAELRRLGVACRFLIAGDGPSAGAMRARIAREGLHQVEMLGVMPFETGLMPLVRKEVDLFVVCHRQGDPSCTYLETLAAGVPIVGYANEAFSGLLALAEMGWSVPLDRPQQLARLISQLSREDLLRRARTGLAFAREHAFEPTFRRRIDHLIQIAERHQVTRGAPVLAPHSGGRLR